MNNCPICLSKHSELVSSKQDFTSDRHLFECPTCGKFSISREMWDDNLDPKNVAGHKLSEKCRAVLSHKVRAGTPTQNQGYISIEDHFLEHIVRDGCAGPTPAMQATNLIRYLGQSIARKGETVDIPAASLYSLIGAPSPAMALHLLQELIDAGIVTGTPLPTGGANGMNLTLAGWEKYEAEKNGNISGNYGFIAMKFNDPALEKFVTDHIKPAIKTQLPFELQDVRDAARAGVIDNIMRAQIRDSAFVIVDLTHDNPGAYWEAGYAEGLGKPVIYICEQQKFDRQSTHFDTNHCTTVMWTNGEERTFTNQLIATLRRSLNLF